LAKKTEHKGGVIDEGRKKREPKKRVKPCFLGVEEIKIF